ncbi:uncharacterized protein LOC130686696 [Daphnia carinata]|uniref:uncharacterized protein LOC130686696 n=1 Tax=Daphnia carinata TaxID=120202 RepID=UPI0028683D1E|nr:uncharacterized protein LOC130686696 [Daphnia carinata]
MQTIEFEDAYAPQRLGNWQVPKNFQERPRIRLGATRTVADDNGHFVGGLPSGGRKNNNHHLRFQSAPLPKTNQLFISGLAVSTAKPAKLANKGNQPSGGSNETASSRKIQSSVENEQELREEDEESGENDLRSGKDESHLQLLKPLSKLSSSMLPENPRKAAMVLAARQKNHRPLPDLMLESRDVLIPRNWNQPEASAVTVETTKAKGPTSCTKRMVVRLLPEGESVIERRPNVMELAIKWDVTSPPSSARTRNINLAAANTKPVEKTLEWLYDAPVIQRSISRPELRNQPINSSISQAQKSPPSDSAHGSARSNDSMASGRSHQCPLKNAETAVNRSRSELGSEPESTNNSPRWPKDTNKAALADLDEPVKNTYRSAVSSASPPKNHFLVSTSAFEAKANERSEPIMLPEYPLQRRSPVLQSFASKSLPTEPKQSMHQPPFPLNEYPPQHTESATSNHYRARDSQPSPHHQCDHDSGIGDVQDRPDIEEEEYEDRHEDPDNGIRHSGQLLRSTSRPCLACHSSPQPNNKSIIKNHKKAPYKQAMKAGKPCLKNQVELEKVIQRRQSYRAPKPAPLSSHARHIRGTLAPPLSAGIGNEPIVDYPDFKRLDSTYRLSYGAHTQTQRRRPKTLTAILNEKNCRQWRS